MVIDNINKINPDEKCEPPIEDVRRDNQNCFVESDRDLVIKFCKTRRDGVRLVAPKTEQSIIEKTTLNLTWLNLRSAPVSCETFGQALKNFPYVEKINLSHNNLGMLSDSKIEGLFDSFYKLKKLEFLDLSNNSIFFMQKSCCDIFFDLILEDRNQLYLYLGNNQICSGCALNGGLCPFVRTLNNRGFIVHKTSSGNTLHLFVREPQQ
jgi:hypothetical protein